jgi:NagD protein
VAAASGEQRRRAPWPGHSRSRRSYADAATALTTQPRGKTRTYGFERITHAIRLVLSGARFIATNPDPIGPSAAGPLPATGSIAALISRATDMDPYFVGKPNPLMMRSALNALGAHSESTTMIGDRMDTDIVAGLEAGLEAILVLSGVTSRTEAERFPYRPSRIVDSVADLVDALAP